MQAKVVLASRRTNNRMIDFGGVAALFRLPQTGK
jgi:hypothetical protein